MQDKTEKPGCSRSSPAAGYVSNAERYSHINDVEHSKTAARYGTVEDAAPAVARSIDHSAYSAAVKVSDDSAALIRESGGPTGRSAGRSTAYTDSPAGAAAPKGSVIKTVAGIAAREAENAIGQRDADAGMTERMEGQAEKGAYKTGKYAYMIGRSIGRGAVSFGQYKAELSQAVTAGTISKLEAKKMLRGRAKSSVVRAGSSVADTVIHEVGRDIEGLQDSDDLGTRAIMMPKNVAVGIKRTAQVTKAVGRSVSNGVRTVKRIGVKAKQILTAHPSAVKFALAAAAALLLITLISSGISAAISALSLKSENDSLSEAFLYVTKLDTYMEADILKIEQRSPQIDEFYYYFNGRQVSREEMHVYTDADQVLAYLDSKYEDYTYSSEIGAEIDAIHAALHSLETETWTRIDYVDVSYIDQATGELVEEKQQVTIYCLDIRLQTMPWERYYEENKDTLLTPQQQEQYDALQEVGVYTFRKSLASPFVGVDWSPYISSRWGWRIHPVSGQPAQHLGLDIAMPGGTPINACHAGTVQTGSAPSGLGNYVRIVMENGDYTEYGHMASIAVANGQTVRTGDVIGYVGSTGNSTGNHLHLAYYENGKSINPWIVTEFDPEN